MFLSNKHHLLLIFVCLAYEFNLKDVLIFSLFTSWFSGLLQGICHLFEVFFHFVFETFGQQNTHPSGKGATDFLNRMWLLFFLLFPSAFIFHPVFFHFSFSSFTYFYFMIAGVGYLDHSYIKEYSFLWSSDRLKTALSRITQDYDQWIKPQLVPFSSSSTSLNVPFSHMDVTLTGPHSTNFVHSSNTSFGLKVFM